MSGSESAVVGSDGNDTIVLLWDVGFKLLVIVVCCVAQKYLFGSLGIWPTVYERKGGKDADRDHILFREDGLPGSSSPQLCSSFSQFDTTPAGPSSSDASDSVTSEDETDEGQGDEADAYDNDDTVEIAAPEADGENEIDSGSEKAGEEPESGEDVARSEPAAARTAFIVTAARNDPWVALQALREAAEHGVAEDKAYSAVVAGLAFKGDLPTADTVMNEAIQTGKSLDHTAYSAMIRSLLKKADHTRAHSTLEMMLGAGIKPSTLLFNEVLAAKVSQAGAEHVWEVFDEMRLQGGLCPTPVTCALLLKTVQHTSKAVHVERVVGLVDTMQGKMDEPLLVSLMAACTRRGWVDLTKMQLERYRTTWKVDVQTPQTFGSLIQASGTVNDVAGAWALWNEMLDKQVMPTCVTFGCMVGTLCSNGDPESAAKLVRNALKLSESRSLVNSVVVCTVIKGLASNRPARVFDFYQEMYKAGINMAQAPFNAMLDFASKSGAMERVDGIMQDMKTRGVEPNVTTYSTILKGYCKINDLETAFDILGLMKTVWKVPPDEVAYNTVLDLLARHGRYAKGVQLLDSMCEDGVMPSSYTLALLIKLGCRSNKVREAFSLCKTVSSKYKFIMNAHVYNNLMQALIKGHDFQGAIGIFCDMLDCGSSPDARTYRVLLSGLDVSGGGADEADRARDAAGLVRAGLGLPSAALGSRHIERNEAWVPGALTSKVVADTLVFIGDHCEDHDLVVELVSDLRRAPNVQLDPSLVSRLTTNAIRRVPGLTPSTASGKAAKSAARDARAPPAHEMSTGRAAHGNSGGDSVYARGGHARNRGGAWHGGGRTWW